MESTFASRVLEFRQRKKLSQAAFAERCGLAQGNITQMEAGTDPKQSNAVKILAGFPDLNPDWLLLGTGPMLRDDKPLTRVAAPAPTETPEPEPPRPAAGNLQIVRLTYDELVAENAHLHRQLTARTNEVVDLLSTEVTRLRKKPRTSADAADVYDAVDAIATEMHAARLVVVGFEQQGVQRQFA